MLNRLFGTDGIRGLAGKFPLDPTTAHAVGVALGEVAGGLAPEPEVIIGMDTRESGRWLAEQVAGGLARTGVRAHFAGVVTTPGIAYLTRASSSAAGVMISASHNPFQDNGIKVFGHSGYKLPDEQEHLVEKKVFALLENGIEPVSHALTVDPSLEQGYEDYVGSTLPGCLSGFSLVVDCGHGAASFIAPRVLERLGARVTPICCAPDGRNINLGCGALHPELLRARVLAAQPDLGVALDGDADRAIFVTPRGRVADGDAILFAAARFLHGRGRLNDLDGKPAVVATVMSSLALERALAARGIRLIRTPVGDRHVLEEMLRSGASLGGEPCGHVIFLEHATTGDGLLTALRVLEIMRETRLGLDDLTRELAACPQCLINVRVRVKKPLDELPAVVHEVRTAERAFGDSGRVLVRFSGTEPVIRVMVEGPEGAKVDTFARRIADVIQQELGG